MGNQIFEKGETKMDEIRNLLEEEIKSEIEDLSALTPGSEEKSAAIDDLAKLYKLKIEETKCETDSNKEQLAEQVKDRYFKLGIAAAEIVLPLIFYAFWMRKGFKFEEEGTYTSTTFKGLFSRFRPTKK
jgi:hypothetical protein